MFPDRERPLQPITDEELETKVKELMPDVWEKYKGGKKALAHA